MLKIVKDNFHGINLTLKNIAEDMKKNKYVHELKSILIMVVLIQQAY